MTAPTTRVAADGRGTPQPRLRPRIGLAMPGGFEFGGIGRIMLYATRAWDASGEGPVWEVIDARGPGSLLLSPLHLVRSLARIASARLGGRLDLLHLNVAGRGSTVRKVILGLWAELLRVPTIVHLHDFDYAADLARRPAWQRALVRRMFRRARFCIVLGGRDRELIVAALGVDPERSAILHNAVPDPGPPRARGTGARPVRLLFLGHLSARKGVPELLAALATPALRGREWRLDLAGGGEVERFRAEAARLGLGDRCRFHGWLGQEETWQLLREGDILVLPSHAEGQAMALLEAMAHGLAIVATEVGAHGEAVTDGREALLVRPGDAAGLAGAIGRLLDEPTLRAQLGEAARRRYLEGFTIDRYADRLAELYRRALAGAASGLP